MSRRNVMLEPHSTAALLQEVTRAACHMACPSAVIYRVVAGLRAFTGECASQADRAFTIDRIAELETLAKQWAAAEIAEYSAESEGAA
jgi:hypothetical protein